jgi:hypothetical protein
MVEDSLKHLTTNIVQINIDAIREVPVTLRYIIAGPSQDDMLVIIIPLLYL